MAFSCHLFLQKFPSYMGQSIQEWTKSVLWKTALKKFQGIWSAYPSIFLKAVFHKIYLVHSWILCLKCLTDLTNPPRVFQYCVKSVKIRSFLWSLFSLILASHFRTSLYSARVRENTDQKKLRIWTIFKHCKIQKDSQINVLNE